MSEYSQITFDFFTPPTTVVKPTTPAPEPTAEQQVEIEQSPAAISEEVIEVVFPEQVQLPGSVTEEVSKAEPSEASSESISGSKAAPAEKSTRGRKSLKSFSLAADMLNIPEDEILFQKQYYSIGEVSEMFQVNASLLRYWESEFDIIQPRKNRKGDRHFRPLDIKNLQLIYDLLRRRKLTIEGAKDFLKRNSKSKERFETIQNLRKIRSFLAELKGSL